MDLQKSVVIFGASGTIGATLARRLAAGGQYLLLVGRNENKLAALASELDQPFVVTTFDSSTTVESAVCTGLDGHHVQAVVNCIGSLLLKPAHLTSDDEFRSVVETNLFSAFTAVRVGAKLLKESGGGAIVLFASAAAEVGIQNHEAISAAKAGIIGLARSAAATYAPNNIRVNVISPGLVRTELTQRIWNNANASAASTQLHALGRLGEPEKIASLAEWLINPENDWITGQVIGVDGGLGHVLSRR